MEPLKLGLYTIFQSMRLENEQKQEKEKEGAGRITTTLRRHLFGDARSITAAPTLPATYSRGELSSRGRPRVGLATGADENC